MPTVFQTRAQGKLLLSGEYFVLDGAAALALPVRFGQSLQASTRPSKHLLWQSQNPDGSLWFEGEFALPDLHALQVSDKKIADTLTQILRACQTQQPNFFSQYTGLKVVTQTEFPRAWGLGTSSTLIAALARWTEADAYQVLADTFGGSGYDIACAYAEQPILYQLTKSDGNWERNIQSVPFKPAYSNQLFFVFLGKKQDSREGIARYREQAGKNPDQITAVTRLSECMLQAETLEAFESTLLDHEQLVAQALGLPRAKDLFFSDFWGEVKSLGAWGGDFVLASSRRTAAETQAYFREKGFPVCMPWNDMAHP